MKQIKLLLGIAFFSIFLSDCSCSCSIAKIEPTISSTPHIHISAEPVEENRIEPTCTEPGGYDVVIYCIDDNVELSREHKTIPALGHDLIHHDGKAATCTEDGYAPYVTCTRCDYSTFTKIKATGHHADEPVEENRIEPTCTEPGGYDVVIYCIDDNVELSREHKTIPALGHDLIHHDGKAATCTEDGYAPYVTCTRCDYSTKVDTEAIGHSKFVEVKKNVSLPTCTQGGSYDLIVYCGVCNEKISESHIFEPALGHDLILHKGKDSSCIEHGYDDYYECSRCDYNTKEQKDLSDHIKSKPVVENIVPPSQDKVGTYDFVIYCSDCGEEISRVNKEIGNCDEIELTRNSATIYEQEYYKFFLVDDSKQVTWSASNEEIVTINSSGKIATYGPGETIIFAADDKGNIATSYLLVKEDYIEISIPNVSYYPGDTVNVSLDRFAREDLLDIDWTSSDNEVATIDENGVIDVLKKGTTIISATLPSGINDSFTLTVKGIYLTMNYSQKTLYVGETVNLVATPSKPGGSQYWSSSDSSIVSVTSSGTITAKALGAAVITAKDSVCGTATCEIIVSEQIATLSKSNYSSYISILSSLSVGESSVTLSITAKTKDGWIASPEYSYITMTFFAYAVGYQNNGNASAAGVPTTFNLYISGGKTTGSRKITLYPPYDLMGYETISARFGLDSISGVVKR